MDLTALRGIAKARWWVLVSAAVIAVVISGRLTEYRNDNLPEFQALTWVTYIEDPQGGLDRGDFVAFLESQFALAQDVNSSVLNDTPGAFLPWLLAEVDLEADQNQAAMSSAGYAGDVNNDGYDDVIVGAERFRHTRLNEGAAWQIGRAHV